ncbi:Laminin subunit beta-4 [Linum perenne]
MAPFNFKSYNHFITSSNGTTLQVYELTKPMVHPFSIRKTDWKEVANINISLEDDDERMSYDGLLFFDGHGGIEGSKALTMLAQHLKRLRLLVNPEGYCFQESGELADYADFGIHYLRLNDLFSWPHHGVELAMITVWSRLEMKYHVSTSKRTKNDGVNLQKKLEELKKLLKERDEELEKLNEELEEAKEAKNEEMEQLRNKLKRKDEELRMLRKKKDKDHEANVKRIEELVKLKDEMEDANEELQKIIKLKNEEMEEAKEAKDEEMEQLRNKLKMKDEEELEKQRKEEMQKANEELQKLRKEKDEELQKMIRDKDDQLQKLVKKKDDEKKDKANEEMRKLRKEKDEELQKMIRDKDDQLQKLGKKKDDEKKDEIARVMKEVEQCSKSSCSWTMSPSVRYLPMDSEGTRVHLTRRRPVPPETFIYGEDPHDFVSCNMPRIEACLNVFNSAQFVDEQNTGWPIPSSFKVLIGKNNRGFDKHNWWFAKANHPEGGLTMLAYYDGNYSKFSSGPDRTIQLPFLKDATLAPFKPFFLLKVHSFGVKLVFMYRV